MAPLISEIQSSLSSVTEMAINFNIQQVFLTSIHNETAFGTQHLKSPPVLKSNQQPPQGQRDQLVPYRQIYRCSKRISSPYSAGMEVQHAISICAKLSNFCGETGDDSAAGLKLSSFNDDISASLLLLVRVIGSANRVLTDAATATAPTQSQSQE